MLPVQVDDGLHLVGLVVLGLQRALGLHDVGHFLHARQVLRRQRGAEGLGLDRLADDLLARHVAVLQGLQGRLGDEVAGDQLGGLVGLLLQQVDGLALGVAS